MKWTPRNLVAQLLVGYIGVSTIKSLFPNDTVIQLSLVIIGGLICGALLPILKKKEKDETLEP